MKAWTADLVASIVEGVLDLIDGFARVQPRIYVATTLVVLAVTLFTAAGPHL